MPGCGRDRSTGPGTGCSARPSQLLQESFGEPVNLALRSLPAHRYIDRLDLAHGPAGCSKPTQRRIDRRLRHARFSHDRHPEVVSVIDGLDQCPGAVSEDDPGRQPDAGIRSATVLRADPAVIEVLGPSDTAELAVDADRTGCDKLFSRTTLRVSASNHRRGEWTEQLCSLLC